MNVEIFNVARSAGCCERCALRCTTESSLDFDNPASFIQKFNASVTDAKESDEAQPKKVKPNPCIVCLDLLQDDVLQEMIDKVELSAVSQYDSDTFCATISLPIAVLIRDHAIGIFMKDKFPELDRHIPINKAWSGSLQNKLAKAVNKKHDKNSNFMIQFSVKYELEEEESSVMRKLDGKYGSFKHAVSRNAVIESLSTVTGEIFKKHVAVPPQPSSKALILDPVTFYHLPIYIAGRYCKYSRALGQSPWVIDNVKIVENSVQEIIFGELEDIFKCKNLVFSSSGREDCDVRTLGRGRPFFVKIAEPKITKVSFEQFRTVEQRIKSTKLMEVRDLQSIPKKDLSYIKDGEENKQKTYRALCIVSQLENLQTYVDKINVLETLTLQQKTPIRVLHRRASMIRTKKIYTISANTVPGRDNLFEMDLTTQAGTYIKEFVHGDLGRTRPSLAKIIGGSVDILALDVLNIHLDFPPPIKYK